MITISEFDDILESVFKHTSSSFSESSQNMKIEIVKSGCTSVIYSFDRNLDRNYKGGLFPFFAKSKGVCAVCDYIVFAIKNNQLYAIVVELKKGNESTKNQLDAAVCLVNFIISTYCRVKRKELICEIRKVSITNPKIRKKKTKMSEPTYDSNNHTYLESSKFYLGAHLI